MFDQLIELVIASPWTYALLAGIVTADALVPLLPGETVVITAACWRQAEDSRSTVYGRPV